MMLQPPSTLSRVASSVACPSPSTAVTDFGSLTDGSVQGLSLTGFPPFMTEFGPRSATAWKNFHEIIIYTNIHKLESAVRKVVDQYNELKRSVQRQAETRNLYISVFSVARSSRDHDSIRLETFPNESYASRLLLSLLWTLSSEQCHIIIHDSFESSSLSQFEQ